MRRFRNLSGTIMKLNSPLIDFKVESGDVIYVKKYDGYKALWEFNLGWSDEKAVLTFLDERLVPETRIGLQSDLEEAGIKYFDPDTILKYNNGNAMTDDFWIRFEDGCQTYEEVCDLRKERNHKRQKVVVKCIDCGNKIEITAPSKGKSVIFGCSNCGTTNTYQESRRRDEYDFE